MRDNPMKSGQVRSGQVRSGQVRSGQVRSGQVRSGQVRSGQVRKLFEHLIRSRLEKELDEKGGLADSQFGFRKGRSTLDAMEEVLKFAETANRGTWGRKDLCAIVAIDVENAFNSAPWKKIIEALEGKRINKALGRNTSR
ncbi:hypothetical protein TcasGA2_TC030937 [Tribolium castaneum]|uniref:Uncharacterized protein n=1 Tax=Tribolium castaneum TaxID=7070 RepID=A0A139WA29_TRICA|nr:hypothetical protein TcasGA2_TC030937 [Tribolium castaneum]